MAPLLSSSKGLDSDHSPVPRHSRQRRNVMLSFTSLLFLYISIHCHCGTAACMSVNAWSLRGTVCPGSSCSAIFPIIKNGVPYDFPDHLGACVTGLAAFPSLMLFHWSSWCYGTSKGTLLYPSLWCSSLVRLFPLCLFVGK